VAISGAGGGRQVATGSDGQRRGQCGKIHYHETVRIRGRDDDVQNIRTGLDSTKAVNYQPKYSIPPPSSTVVSSQWRGRGTGRKRSSNHTDTSLPPSKRSCSRSCSTSPTLPQSIAVPNQIYRRVILRGFGKAIYKASSRASLLAALEGCIEGYESLRTKAGILPSNEISQSTTS
jgi:Fungal protein kinase